MGQKQLKKKILIDVIFNLVRVYTYYMILCSDSFCKLQNINIIITIIIFISLKLPRVFKSITVDYYLLVIGTLCLITREPLVRISIQLYLASRYMKMYSEKGGSCVLKTKIIRISAGHYAAIRYYIYIRYKKNDYSNKKGEG